MRPLEHLPMAIECPKCSADHLHMAWIEGIGAMVYQQCRACFWSGPDVTAAELVAALQDELAHRVVQNQAAAVRQ